MRSSVMLKLPAFLKPKRQLNLLIAGLFLALQMPLFLVAPAASANHGGPHGPDPKVFVCKYVGTPGTNERLQTGNNPISVSINSIPNYQGPGSYFADQQGRSFVLQIDNTNPGPSGDPDVSACPAPAPDVVQVPVTLLTTDPCNPQGVTNNVAWMDAIPADTATIDWSESNGGATRTATLIGNNVQWSDQTTAPKVFNLPADSGIACEIPVVVVSLPAVPSVNDPCGLDNATWNIPEDTETLRWDLEDGELVVTILAANTTFPGGATSYNYGLAADSNEACPEERKITICHATSAVKNPYTSNSVSINAADGISGNSQGNQPDHYGEHAGPIFNPLTNENGDDWGDIIPPIEGIHSGLNWTTEGQAIWNNGCNVPENSEPEAPTVSATINPCTPDSGLTDTITVTVTNTNDDTNETVTYTVTLGGQTKYITLDDGESGDVIFDGLEIGDYSAVVSWEDADELIADLSLRALVDLLPADEPNSIISNTVTVALCEEEGDILGEVIPTGGQGAAVVTPQVLADTGKNLTASMFAAIAIIGATCALAITSRRARFNQ